MIYIILYFILSAILLFFLTRGNWKEWILKMIIVSFLPIIGWLFPSIWPKKWIRKDQYFFSNYLAEQSSDISIELLKSQNKIERDKELNVVSIEEALIVNDYAVRRHVLIDVLKEDTMQFIDVLKTAVINEDTETSHYAVTAVIEVKRKLTISLQKLAVEFSNHPTDSQLANGYADIIKEYLRSGFIDAQLTKQYQITYIEVLNQIILNKDATENTFVEKINMELKTKNTIAAEATLEQFKTQFPLCEQAYLCGMKIYFETLSFEKLQAELLALKSLPITLSHEAITNVRYWSGVSQVNEGITK